MEGLCISHLRGWEGGGGRRGEEEEEEGNQPLLKALCADTSAASSILFCGSGRKGQVCKCEWIYSWNRTHIHSVLILLLPYLHPFPLLILVCLTKSLNQTGCPDCSADLRRATTNALVSWLINMAIIFLIGWLGDLINLHVRKCLKTAWEDVFTCHVLSTTQNIFN